jgi:hypothetical protein
MKEFAEVRAMVGGIRGVIQKLGDAPPDGRWSPMTKCPFCGASKTASVYNKGGVDFFICHQRPGRNHAGCNTGNRSLAEVNYIAMREGLSEAKPETGPSPAYRRLLELAGCWEEPRPKAAPKQDATSGAPAPAEGAASPAPSVVPTEPEPKPEPASEIAGGTPALLSGEPPSAEVTPPTPRELPLGISEPVDEEEQMIARCIAVIRAENKASVRLLQKHLKLGYTRATRIMDTLEKRGIVGPTKGQEPRDILKLPDQPGLITIKIGEEIHIEEVKPTPASGGGAPGEDTRPTGASAQAASNESSKEEPASSQLPVGMKALRWFFSRLRPTESEMRASLPGGLPVPDPLPEKVAKRLEWHPVPLFIRRGLTSITCDALGLRANPPENEGILREMEQHFSWDERRASGTWLDANKRMNLGRRPNAQFHGKGQLGKKPDKERRNKEDKWVWGFCQPVLIPYFDEAGDLIKLRPHKGGAPGGTIAGRARIYVPRDYRRCGDVVEKFFTVVICEGEYKAMAIWQTLGMGAKLQFTGAKPPPELPVVAQGQPSRMELPPWMQNFEPVGVCALPGISYVTNVEMRMDLERWLSDVGARRVIVAFDDEDKSDKPMRQRFDAQRDARVLATELSQILHVDARVCVLPREWRNARGKADWDGALVKILKPVAESQTSNKS